MVRKRRKTAMRRWRRCVPASGECGDWGMGACSRAAVSCSVRGGCRWTDYVQPPNGVCR